MLLIYRRRIEDKSKDEVKTDYKITKNQKFYVKISIILALKKKSKVCFANTKTIAFIFSKPSPSVMEYIRKLMLRS
jgi:hypothetical protein